MKIFIINNDDVSENVKTVRNLIRDRTFLRCDYKNSYVENDNKDDMDKFCNDDKKLIKKEINTKTYNIFNKRNNKLDDVRHDFRNVRRKIHSCNKLYEGGGTRRITTFNYITRGNHTQNVYITKNKHRYRYDDTQIHDDMFKCSKHNNKYSR